MKIGLIIYGNLDTLSGGYLYDRMLVQALRREGHDVQVISLPWRNYLAHLADNVRLAWARKVEGLSLDLLLQDELNHPSLLFLSAYWAQTLACPQISIVHHLRSSEDHPAWLLPFYRAVERSYLRHVDGFIFNSLTSARAVSALVARDYVSHIAYPAADHVGPPSAEEIHKTIQTRGMAEGPLRVLFVGTVIPRKGLHYLARALADLDGESWRLDIVGDDSVAPAYVSQVRREMARRGLEPSVMWHGRVDDAALRRLLTCAHVFALPSYEGFGIVFLEAMAFGLPVLAADIGAAWETVQHGVNGFLTPRHSPHLMAECLQTLHRDRVQLTEMSLAARLVYEKHCTWESSMDGCIRWLHELTAG